MGIISLRDLHGGFGVFGAESWAGDGVGDSNLHFGDWIGEDVPEVLFVLDRSNITGIGGVAGSVVAGAIFTLPALYILKLDPHPIQTIFICVAGGCLGVLFLIPLRRYFVREQHGLLPFPEATAITEVLVTGEKGGSQAKLLLQATAIAAVYDFLVTTFQVWKEYLDFRFVPAVRMLAERARMAFSFDAIGFTLGLGYVIGLAEFADFVCRRNSVEHGVGATDLVCGEPPWTRRCIRRQSQSQR